MVLTYLLIIFSLVAPFVLLFYAIKSIHERKPVVAAKQLQIKVLRPLALSLSLVHIGILISPIFIYLAGGFVQSTNLHDSFSPTPFQQIIMAIILFGFLAFMFIGSITACCILVIRTLENPKAS